MRLLRAAKEIGINARPAADWDDRSSGERYNNLFGIKTFGLNGNHVWDRVQLRVTPKCRLPARRFTPLLPLAAGTRTLRCFLATTKATGNTSSDIRIQVVRHKALQQSHDVGITATVFPLRPIQRPAVL